MAWVNAENLKLAFALSQVFPLLKLSRQFLLCEELHARFCNFCDFDMLFFLLYQHDTDNVLQSLVYFALHRFRVGSQVGLFITIK